VTGHVAQGGGHKVPEDGRSARRSFAATAVPGDHLSVWFWVLIIAIQALMVPVALRSPVLGAGFAGAVGVLAILVQVVGTRRGTLWLVVALVAVVIILPGDLALQYRIPLGGGGIFIIDVMIALLLASAFVVILAESRLALVRSPVSLPLLLFLGWVGVAAGIGWAGGNDPKLIIQDGRALFYYVLFFFAVLFIDSRRLLLMFLRVLAVCMVAAFVLGVIFAAQGQGMALEFVEAGVSRFPAPDGVFLMGSVLVTTFMVMWPSGKQRPRWLWALLLIALLGLLLSFVRGNWVAYCASMAYLFFMLRARQRAQLLAGSVVVVLVLAAGLAVTRPALLDSLVSRAMAITAVEDRNVQWRLIEDRAVGAQIAEHPIFGNGLGKEYLFDFSRYGVAPYRKSFIHNSYYAFLNRLGIVGTLLFAWWAIAFLVPWMRRRDTLPTDDPWLLGTVYGGRAMMVAVLVVSITAPHLGAKTSVAIISLVMGMSEVSLALLSRRAGEQDAEAQPQSGSE
jgi:hypothetical protein